MLTTTSDAPACSPTDRVTMPSTTRAPDTSISHRQGVHRPVRRPLRRPLRRLMIGMAAAAIATGTLATSAASIAHAAPRGQLRPVTECVIVNGDGTFTAFFGYDNATGRPVEVRTGEHNRVSGARVAAPSSFASGRHVAVFSATTDGRAITWHLDDREATATPRSQPCSTNPSVPEAPVTLALLVAPVAVTGWWFRRRQRLQPC
jgi:hypothetical protein